MERFFVVGHGLISLTWEWAYEMPGAQKTSLAITRERVRRAMTPRAAYAAGYFFGYC